MAISLHRCKMRDSRQTVMEIDGSFTDQCRRLIEGMTYAFLTSPWEMNFHLYSKISLSVAPYSIVRWAFTMGHGVQRGIHVINYLIGKCVIYGVGCFLINAG